MGVTEIKGTSGSAHPDRRQPGKKQHGNNQDGKGRDKMLGKYFLVFGFAASVTVFFLFYNRYLTPEKITAAESLIRSAYTEQPLLFLSIAFVIYVAATGLSLPISTVLSLSYAWILGWAAVPLLNVAATCGATLAFLSARFLFRDWVQRRFEKQFHPINRGFEQDGPYYVISLRMVALFPFVVVNLVLGLVPIRTRTYFFSTMIGMLPLNFAFVYLGMQIPSAEEFLREGAGSLISWQVVLAIGLIGLVPLVLRLVSRILLRSPSDRSPSGGEKHG